MKVLVIGAGVVGSVYGAALAEAGHSVSVLEHGSGTNTVALDGFVVRDVTNSTAQDAQSAPVAVVADAAGRYELVLVCVWADQIASVFDSLRPLTGNPALLFLGNNPGGHATVAKDLPGTVLLGFPGIGGSRNKDGVIEFVRIPRQPTTLESGGGSAVEEFDAALRRQRFATTRTGGMDGWLAYHGVFVGSIAAALRRCHGDATELSEDRGTLKLMCRSIEEGFGALRRQAIGGLPRNLQVLHCPPLRPVAVRYWAHTMRSPMGERCFAAHARHAESEMRALAVDALHRTANSTRTSHLRQLLG